jgi:tRNA nucleotidyltransferase (CCA-adding enzyme)
MDINLVLKKELENISVSRSEVLKLKKTASDFINLLSEKGLSAQVGGSLAKGTLIRRDGLQDIDIFVVFDYSEDISSLGDVLNKIKLPGVLNPVHGSRDYFQVICEDVILEIIPVVKNKDPERAENVTDISLSHVKYVKSQIKNNPKFSEEIKLAKAFCQANRCYGADSYIKGFSGYSL